MDIRGALIIAIVCSILLVAINKAHADELPSVPDEVQTPTEMYMPNSAGGFLTLANDSCPDEDLKTEFPYRAYETDEAFENGTGGEQREGCWHVAPHLEGTLAAAYGVLMNEDGLYLLATLGFRLFNPEKKRWPDVAKTCDGCGTM